MNYADILKTEYKEQYNQYRWIGQMQLVVLTVYGVITTFAAAAVAAFLPKPPADIDYSWPAAVMIALGCLGLFIGRGLFYSRTMQRRIAWYLTDLIIQMASFAEDFCLQKDSTLRFRSLCSTRNRLKLWDTMNVVILITLYCGEAFVMTGIFAFLRDGKTPDKTAPIGVLCICIVILLAIIAITPLLVQKLIMDKETKRMEVHYRKAEGFKTLEEMRVDAGLPKKKIE